MTAVAAWRGVFIERLKATGNITLAASGAGVARQHAYRTRNRSKAFRRLWENTSVTTTGCDRTARSRSTHRRGGYRRGGRDLAECKADPSWAASITSRSLTRFSGQFTCRHHAASAAAGGLLSYSTGLRSPIEV